GARGVGGRVLRDTSQGRAVDAHLERRVRNAIGGAAQGLESHGVDLTGGRCDIVVDLTGAREALRRLVEFDEGRADGGADVRILTVLPDLDGRIGREPGAGAAIA